jgi:hypothetical protein
MDMIAPLLLGWVLVMNPDGIRNKNGYFAFGESCALSTLENVETVATPIEGKVLYRLPAGLPRYESAAGSACPKGTLFLMTEDEFESKRAKEKAYLDAQAHLRDTIQRTLRDR